jgi:hypothetical protein
MTAREDYPKLHVNTSGPSHQGETSSQAQAALDEIDALRVSEALLGQLARLIDFTHGPDHPWIPGAAFAAHPDLIPAIHRVIRSRAIDKIATSLELPPDMMALRRARDYLLDSPELADAYRMLPDFRVAVDQLLAWLPHMVAGLLPAALDAKRRREEALAAYMVQSPQTFTVIDLLRRPDTEAGGA